MKKKSANFILVGDIESSDLDPNKGCLLEVGIVELNINNGAKRMLFDETIKEDRIRAKDRNGWIFVNGFMTIEEIRNSEPLSEYQEQIQSILDEYQNMTCWNSTFDFSWLRSRNFNMPNELPCPMKTSAKWFDLPYKSGRGRGKFASVDEAWVALMGENTGYKEIHRAGDDAMHESDIIYKLYKDGVIWNNLKFE